MIKTAIKELCEGNPVVKRFVNIGAIAKDIYDADTIIQVMLFYKDVVVELERDKMMSIGLFARWSNGY